tara:strand:- start:134 stop:685 length:552 start_codon:yes stop_codon:yes gene_type:complete
VKKSTKAPKTVVETVAQTTETSTTPVVEVNPVEELQQQFAELLTSLSVLKTQLSAVTQATKKLQARNVRELKAATKAKGKRNKKKNGEPRAPSGFVKPTRISAQLAKFLGKPADTLMARTQVTSCINQYAKAHGLQDENNGRIIHPDGPLKKLLGLKEGQELTYFNLQTHMKKHFPKTVATSN